MPCRRSSEPLKPRAGQTRAGAVYASASPAVVSIRAGNATGTGFLIDRDGPIVTNSHVVDGNERVEVRFGADSDSIEAEVRGTDPSSDLAVVEIDPEVPAGVKPLRLADSRDVRVGDVAIAIGNPFGLDRTATEGIVSGVGREIQAPNGFSIDSVIQTDAPINPGNSGGPLLDDARPRDRRELADRDRRGSGNVGIGFAVPSNTVRQVVPALMPRRADQARLPRRRRPRRRSTLEPVAARRCRASSRAAPPTARASGTGDVITRVDGQPVARALGRRAGHRGRQARQGGRGRGHARRVERDPARHARNAPGLHRPMSFAAPLVLLALLALPVLAVLYVLEQRRRRAAAAAFAAPALQPSVAPRRPGWRRHAPMAVAALALALLVVAAAKPQRTVAVPVERAVGDARDRRVGLDDRDGHQAQPAGRGQAGGAAVRGRGARRA